MGDGDGWARCRRGHVHWGRHGAAGLLLYHYEPEGEPHVLLQQRAWWCNGGGTWGLFGGGRHSHEDEVTAALRETSEECSLDVSAVRVHGMVRDDHGGWDFTTVVGSITERPDVRPDSFETRKAEWVPISQVERMRLFPPFEGSWQRLRGAISRVRLVVDGANVVGSRPDGWWKDRAGAAARLRDRLSDLAVSGLPGHGGIAAPDSDSDPASQSDPASESDPASGHGLEAPVPVQVPAGLPPGLPPVLSALSVCYPEIILVVEGAAREIAAAAAPVTGPAVAPHGSYETTAVLPRTPAVRVVAAEHSGDDAIVNLVGAGADEPDVTRLVITADRELRERCATAGASSLGPRWLLQHLDRLGDPGRSGPPRRP